MDRYCTNLNLPFKLLRDDVNEQLSSIDSCKDTLARKIDLKDFYSIELLEFLNRFDFDYYGVILSFPPSNDHSIIHVDNHDLADQTNFNVTIGGEDSKTTWWETTNQYAGQYKVNAAGTVVLKYEKDRMKEVFSTHISGACLFQAGLPHSVYNPLKNRHTITAKLRKKGSKIKPIFYSDALEIFKEYIGR
jgi:hypothetical protein